MRVVDVSSRLRRPSFSVVGPLVIALTLVVGTGVASAKKAKLHVKPPRSVQDGATWAVLVTGFSGKFDSVGVHAFKGRHCPSTESDVENLFGRGQQFNVDPNQPFSFSPQFIAANPGRHEVCAYLFSGAMFDGPQVHKAAAYKVTGP
jgi:hypothetical protein